jgi:DNA-binding FadR family transcriptional regulator
MPVSAARIARRRPRTVHDTALAALGSAIVAGRWPPGTALPPEPQLGEELGVSRTVVREAVKSLAAKGLVVAGPKLGTRVLPVDQWNWFDAEVVAWQVQAGFTHSFLRDLVELRRTVEPAAVRLAAERATAEDVSAIEAAYAGMEHSLQSRDPAGYVLHDLAFHQGMLRASHNRMLGQMAQALGALLRASFELGWHKPKAASMSLPQHRVMLDAVKSRDPNKAEKACLSLIDAAGEEVARLLDSGKRLPPVLRRGH